MTSQTVDSAELRGLVTALREELTHLRERLQALEAAVGTKPAAPPPPPVAPAAPPAPPKAEPAPLSDELVLVLSAAIAAFLGFKPHIRQIRLLGTKAWAQQGRVTIQASHALGNRLSRSPH